MTPEDVSEELLEAAELALADWCNERGRGGIAGAPACACPDLESVRVVLSAVLPEVLEQASNIVTGSIHGLDHSQTYTVSEIKQMLYPATDRFSELLRSKK